MIQNLITQHSIKRDKKGQSPDWGGFAEKIKESFIPNANNELEKAVACLKDNPPKKTDG
jgi:hypothetical protein